MRQVEEREDDEERDGSCGPINPFVLRVEAHEICASVELHDNEDLSELEIC